MKNIVLRYGIQSGCVLIILGLLNWFLVAFTFGCNVSQIVGYLSMVIALLAVPAGIKYFRDQLNQGRVSFFECLKVGGGISLLSSTVMFFYSVLFFLFQGERFYTWAEENFDGKQLEQMQAMPEYVFTPWCQGLIMFLTVLVIGMIITLVSSLMLKRA